MKKTTFLFTFVMMFMTLIWSCNNQSTENEETKMTEKTKAIAPANMDKSIIPGVDFYQFVNGGWMAANPIPEEKTRFGAFDVLAEQNKEDLKALIMEAAEKKAEKGSNAQKIGDFYASGMDTLAINEKGFEPIKPFFEKIDALKSNDELVEFSAYLQTQGMSPFFYIYSDQDKKNTEQVIANMWQGGLGLPDRDYYTKDDDRSKEIREEYVKHLTRMFALVGDNEATATANAQTVMRMETRIAKASNTRLANRDPQATYNKKTVAEWNAELKNIDFASYFQTIGYPEISELNVEQTKFLSELDKMIAEEKIEDWKTYLRWSVIGNNAGILSDDFVMANFDFYSKTLSGQTEIEPRWKRMIQATSGSLGEAIGQLYVEKHFPKEAKERMLDLVGNLKKALNKRITNLAWMTPETKNEAIAKLDAMNVKIGYPDKWKDYSSLEISADSYAQNVMNARNFRFKENMDKIGKPVDRTEWGMTPQTVNAYYSPTMNEIVFPAAILQPPFFDLYADDAVNYGAIGVVIGHEMTHGFDDQGRQFDKKGNLSDWWTEADADEFNKRVQLLVNQYDEFVAIDSMHVDGKLTLGENIADFGGLTVALEAYRMSLEGKPEPADIDGYTNMQRYFLSYAQVWRQNIRDKALKRQVQEDVHSPGRFRVNGALFNVPEFYAAFDIKPEDPLYRTEAQRPIIW